MANVKTHIWYDASGTILAIGHVPARTVQHAVKAIPFAREGQKHLEVEISEELLPNLHATHGVDPKKAVLFLKR